MLRQIVPDSCCGLHKSLQVKGEAPGSGDGPEEDQMALESLSMEQVLQNGTPLLASGGQVRLQRHNPLSDLRLTQQVACVLSSRPLTGPP